jgi:hypothetical protein
MPLLLCASFINNHYLVILPRKQSEYIDLATFFLLADSVNHLYRVMLVR